MSKIIIHQNKKSDKFLYKLFTKACMANTVELQCHKLTKTNILRILVTVAVLYLCFHSSEGCSIIFQLVIRNNHNIICFSF